MKRYRARGGRRVIGLIAGVAIFAAINIALLSSSLAQVFCATNFGRCMMANGMPGGPCFCATPNGPIQGITQFAGGGAAFSPPQFCCTPAGRMGPLNLGGAGPGQVCQVPTPAGFMQGQACY
jgi:hypothetical protein